MRLLFLTNIPTPYRTPFYQELHRQLSMSGHELLVLYCAQTEPNRQWPFDPHAQQYPFTIMKGWTPAFKSFFPHINISVIRKIRQYKPDFFIAAGSWNTPTVVIAVLGAKLPKNRKAFWSEGHVDATVKSKGLVQALRRWVYRQFGVFCVPNEKSAAFVRDFLQVSGHFITLPNTIDDAYFAQAPLDTKDNLRRQYGLPTERRIIVQVSQLVDRKGIVEIIEGFELFEQRHPNHTLTFMLIGDGPLMGLVQDSIRKNQWADRFIAMGHQNMAEIKDLLYAADVFALFTKRDPNPLTPVEAAFCRLPLVISTKAGNVAELIIDNETGWRLETVAAEPIASLLGKIQETEARKLSEMGENAFRHTARQFSLPAVCAGLLSDIERQLKA